ncbi:MAG: glycerol-3-phosphate 1-O-acyltransferase PlsY [Candidatus Nealsonbacteria bacterium]|nr:glycerol-3-phosphate 1-O-acyltransferase PlsY [Candidatus Nealsonbacteria bacterium]
MFKLFLLLFFGYLLGSIPSGYLISKRKGVDIRKVGSGNIGGTNVSRAFGLKWGVIVGVLDIFKGVIPAYLAIHYLSSDWQMALVAVSPVLGHIFPVWIKFKGGKGVATSAGALFVLLGQKYVLILFLIWILTLLTVRVMSFASISMASFIPLMLWLDTRSLGYFALGFALAGLIFWAHRENIKRIKNQTEPKFKFKKSQEQLNNQ